MVSVLFRSRFSVFGKNKVGFSDFLLDAVWCFSGFSSENLRLNDLNPPQPRARLLWFCWVSTKREVGHGLPFSLPVVNFFKTRLSIAVNLGKHVSLKFSTQTRGRLESEKPECCIKHNFWGTVVRKSNYYGVPLANLSALRLVHSLQTVSQFLSLPWTLACLLAVISNTRPSTTFFSYLKVKFRWTST